MKVKGITVKFVLAIAAIMIAILIVFLVSDSWWWGPPVEQDKTIQQ